MDLIKKTYSLTALWMLPVIVLGSIFCFYMIRYISYEETDEFLNYEMERLAAYYQEFNELPEYSKVADIIPDLWYDTPVLRDTLILEPGDNELVPHRELRFSIQNKGKNYTIVLRQLLPGQDDIAEGTLFIIVGFVGLIAVSLIVILNMVNKRIWNPFYNTLGLLRNYKISDPMPSFRRSSIDEFEGLNNTLSNLLKKISDDYLHTKEFNENATHELQTHLAVIRTNTEKLINDPSGNFQNIPELHSIYSAVTKLSKAQRSLLLLSRISNREFINDTDVNLENVLRQSLSLYKEAIELRKIRVLEECSPVRLMMDAGLAEILMNNLIKNAVKHNTDEGFIHISLNSYELRISNSGQAFEGNPEDLMKRFSKGVHGNIGIGLAIVRQICEMYNFRIAYTISGKTEHVITIFFT